MDRELEERVMLERVEMIARLAAEGDCRDRDREIALDLIAEIVRVNLMKNNAFSIVFAARPLENNDACIEGSKAMAVN